MSDRDTKDSRHGDSNRQSGTATDEAPSHALERLHADPRIAHALYQRMQRKRREARAATTAPGDSSAGSGIPQAGGTALDAATRSRLEPHVGAELSAVRVHTDDPSAHAADALGAKAFAIGSDIHFGKGEYAPGTKAGDELLAHEATHVAHHDRGAVHLAADPQAGPGESTASEHHADAVAARATTALHGEGSASATTAGAEPAAASAPDDWQHHLAGLHRSLADQVAAEREALEALRANRAEHPIVGGTAEALASIKSFHHVAIPDSTMWDPVLAQLERAHASFASEKPNIEAAKLEMAAAVRLFKDAHRRVYEYRSRTEGGAETAASVLRGVEIGCDILVFALSAGAGAAGANAAKIGLKQALKLGAEAAANNLVKTAAVTGAVTGANALAKGAAAEGANVAAGLEDHFDLARVIGDAGEEAILNTIGVLVGGALSRTFTRGLGELLMSRVPPAEAAQLAAKLGIHGTLTPEVFVTRGWKFVVGIAGDAATTVLTTAVSSTIGLVRGGKLPTAQAFVELVVKQMIQGGIVQLIFSAATHERAGGGTGAHEPRVGHEPAKAHEHHPSANDAKSSAGEAKAVAEQRSGAGPQKTRDLDLLYQEAATAQSELAEITNTIAQECGGRALIPTSLKGRPRALEKINADYGDDASRITDLARATLIFDRVDQVAAAAKAVQKRCKVVRLKDRFQKPADGYRDMLFNVETPNGHVCELQLHLEGIQKVKSGEGHKLYEQIRTIEARSKLENRDLTPDETKEIMALKEKMKDQYDAAYAKSGGSL